MKETSSLKRIKQGKYSYISLYYKYLNNIIRINTGNEFIPSCMNKDLSYNSKMVNYFELNRKTQKLKQKVDGYIQYKIKCNSLHTISKKECTDFINGNILPNSRVQFEKRLRSKKPTIINGKKNQLRIRNLLDEFYEYKKDELNNRPSYKDYLSLTNSLKDFQKYYSTELTFDVMNTLEFLVKYRNFLSLNRDKSFLTRGGLNDNTINKRFSGLKTFFLWIENKEIYQFKKSILNFSIPKFNNNIVVLDKEDIRQLLNLQISNSTWVKIIEVFVCNCFLGLRYSDLYTLRKYDFILDGDGDYVLIKENKKTGVVVHIPVQKTSLDILKRYDFDLPKFSHQYFNRELRKILVEYKLFPERIVKKRRVNRINEDYELLRRDLITSHTCRRTFITLGISNNVPLNSLMLSTGHQKIQTLQNYMKKVMDKKSFNKIDL